MAVEPQVFDVIHYLLSQRDRVVSKDDLLNAIWHGRAVSDSTLTSRVNAARRALGDSGDEQRLMVGEARRIRPSLDRSQIVRFFGRRAAAELDAAWG